MLTQYLVKITIMKLLIMQFSPVPHITTSLVYNQHNVAPCSNGFHFTAMVILLLGDDAVWM
jgi:hypothetical protein